MPEPCEEWKLSLENGAVLQFRGLLFAESVRMEGGAVVHYKLYSVAPNGHVYVVERGRERISRRAFWVTASGGRCKVNDGLRTEEFSAAVFSKRLKELCGTKDPELLAQLEECLRSASC